MKKIGIIDSGIGGLTFLKQLLNKNLNAQYFYIGDSDHVPYGEKTQEFMLERMKMMSSKLIDKGVDGIFIACNTATAQTIDKLRSSFSIPFIGIEPYINYLNHSKNHDPSRIALILTQATYHSERFQTLKASKDPKGLINVHPLKKLAMIIERLKNNQEDHKKTYTDIKEELSFLNQHSYKYLILGCTHYPIIQKFIEETYNVACIDPSSQVISHLVETFNLNQALDDQSQNGIFQANFDNTHLWAEDNIKNYPFLP